LISKQLEHSFSHNWSLEGGGTDLM
jgi:hypothetical protein